MKNFNFYREIFFYSITNIMLFFLYLIPKLHLLTIFFPIIIIKKRKNLYENFNNNKINEIKI